MSVTVSAVIRWAVCDPDSGAFDGDGADEQLPAASTIKLFVASAFWRSQLDPDELVGEIPPAGSAGLAEHVSPRARLTLGDLALAMLAVSDNAATNFLLDRLGLDAVNEEIAWLGLERTHVRRRMMSDGSENVTTAGDLARGLAALADHAHIRRALAVGAETASILPAYLPGVTVLPKSGELDDVRHEIALLEQDGRRRVVAILSSPPTAPHELAFGAAEIWRKPLRRH
jgi:beta-lactamase class A